MVRLFYVQGCVVENGAENPGICCVVFLSYRSGRFGQGIWTNPVAGHGFFRKVDRTENPVVLS